MILNTAKFKKEGYLEMVLRDRLRFLQTGTVHINGRRFSYPHWPYFFGIFHEVFVEDNYRIDGLKDVKYIIDAGANIGVSAAYFAREYPHARIDCFEPNPEALAYLRKNVASYPNVRVEPYALGMTDGTTTFYTDTEIDGSSMAGTINFLEGKHRKARTSEVEMRRLSGMIDGTVDILKLDIEGAEFAVLEDLVSTGKISLMRTILLEYHFEPKRMPHSFQKLAALLESNGFFYYIRKGAPVTVAERVLHTYMLFAFRPSETAQQERVA